MTSQDIDNLDQILDKLSIGTQQETHPPYTEDNRPQGLIYIKGKKQAKAALLKWRDDKVVAARIEEMDTLPKDIPEVRAYAEARKNYFRKQLEGAE